ncbi:MAG: glycosyltransferase [Lachnospiraceae bacterium]
MADSPQQYAEHILSLLQSESLRERIGRVGQRLIENKYTWNSLTTQWLSLLSSSARKD